MGGKPIQYRVLDILRARQKPLSAADVAMILETDVEQTEFALAVLFANSKVERRLSLYRMPERQGGERFAREPQRLIHAAELPGAADVCRRR